MGWYIEMSCLKGKADHLIKTYGAVRIGSADMAKAILEREPDKGVICVIDNPLFEAAAFVYDLREFQECIEPGDPRPRVWLTMDRQKAEQLSGWKKS